MMRIKKISLKTWGDYLLTLALAIVAALFVRYFILAAYRVPTSSMAPTLRPGDFIFSSQMSYGVRIPGSQSKLMAELPARGDVVIFRHPGKSGTTYVKRVIALPGDRIEIKEGRLILNDQALAYTPVDAKFLADFPGMQFHQVFEESYEGKGRLVMYSSEGLSASMAPRVIGEGEVFVMGDNRDASDDSRDWGPIPAAEVEGKATCIWLSLDWQSLWLDSRMPQVRWNRIFTCLN